MFLCIFQLTFSQDTLREKDKMIGFGCYSNGKQSISVEKVSDLIYYKKFEEIKALMFSENIAEKYLAIMTLTYFDKNGILKLTNNEKKIISGFKKSDEEVFVCSGCTFFEMMKVKALFKKKNFIHKATINFIKDYYEMPHYD